MRQSYDYGMLWHLKYVLLSQIYHVRQSLCSLSKFSTIVSSPHRVKSDGIVYATVSADTKEDNLWDNIFSYPRNSSASVSSYLRTEIPGAEFRYALRDIMLLLARFLNICSPELGQGSVFWCTY